MRKDEIQKRINGLNEYMLSNSDLQLLLLKISNDYTYTKAVALIEKNDKRKNWYSVDDKEVDAFIDGLCKGKNTNFEEHER